MRSFFVPLNLALVEWGQGLRATSVSPDFLVSPSFLALRTARLSRNSLLSQRLILMRYFQWKVEFFESVWNPDNCDMWVMERDERGGYQVSRCSPIASPSSRIPRVDAAASARVLRGWPRKKK